jgi:DNA-binding LacI/PurR family transcriptional regulator
MVKLVDVAKAAGVSRGTASNVFAHPELVGTELRTRVEAAALALGYSGPDPKARLLRAGKVNAIGVVPFGPFSVADAITIPLFRQVLAGVGEICDEYGASLSIFSGAHHQSSGGIRNALVDGFILTRTEDLDEVLTPRLRGLPFVVMDVDPRPGLNVVEVDVRPACRAAARHLLQLGHRRFGIVSFLRADAPAVFHPPARDRPKEIAGMRIDQEKFAGYAEAFAEAGIAMDDVSVLQAYPPDPAAAAQMMDLAPEATAFLSMSDLQAIGIMAEARRRGLIVPRDLSVIGFNDIPEAILTQPRLTTVNSMAVERGRAAARIVFEGGVSRHEVVNAKLVVRGSTASAPR